MRDPNTRTEFDHLQFSIVRNWLLRERVMFFSALGVSLMVAGSFALYFWVLNDAHFQVGLYWLSSAWIATIVLYFLLRSGTRRGVRLLGVLAASLALAWGSVVLYLTGADVSSWTLFIGLMLLLNFNLPWSLWQQLPLVIAHLGILFVSGVELSQVVGLASLAVIAVVALRSSGVARVHFLSDISIVDYLRLSDAVDSQSLIRTLGMELSLLARTLIIYGNDRAELFHDGEMWQAESDTIYYRGMTQRSMEQEFHDAVFSREELGPDFNPALESWFGTVPDKIMVFRALHLRGDREEQVLIVVPAMPWFSLVSFRRVFLDLCYVVSVFRTGLQIMRTRALSSGLLTATQHSISEQEYEVHELIHHVNNMAQDISIICSNARDELSAVDGPNKTALTESLNRIEIASRALSHEVSDLKIERELDKRLDDASIEQRDFSGMMEELSAYASHRAFRKGMDLSVINEVAPGRLFKICSGEYFATALRGVLRYMESQLPKGGKIAVVARSLGDLIEIELSDNGAQRKVTLDDASAVAPPLKRLLEMVRASLGKIEVVSGTTEFPNILKITLGSSMQGAVPKRAGAQWALFVDDDPEINIFYGRVAGALNLSSHTASSCKEAKRMLDELGRPRIVITDLELEDGSGVDIIRDVRTRFGGDVPVIVVSGHSDGPSFEAAKREGSARFLVKPVGRRKLFAEIQEILAR